MRILFIRHGDPDYINDTLTKKGHREAKLLAERAADLNLGSCYVSPLGRAKDTAQYCLDKVGKTAQTVEWLREFPARIDLNQAVHLQKAYPTAEKENGRYVPRIVWDIVPSYWMEHGECMDRDAWRKSDLCQNSDAVEVYDRVTLEFDRFLAEHGYVREGGDRDVFLPFWDYVRVVVASVEYVAFFGMAVFCVCSDIGDGNSDRRTREGNRLFSGVEAGRCFSSLCGKRTGFRCRQVL